MCLTPVGAASDGYAKTARIFHTARRLSACGLPTFAWRQGVFGPGLVAAGLAGYETGACTREHADVRSQITRKKPKADSKHASGGPPRMVYLEGLGRSVTLDVARALLGDLDTRARLICDDESCCQHGVDSMLDNRVRHTINARARRIRDLNAMPESAWRLHQIAKDAEQAVRTTKRASLTLRRLGIATKLESGAQESLARIADHLASRTLTRRARNRTSRRATAAWRGRHCLGARWSGSPREREALGARRSWVAIVGAVGLEALASPEARGYDRAGRTPSFSPSRDTELVTALATGRSS